MALRVDSLLRSPSKASITRTGESSVSRWVMSASVIKAGTFQENFNDPKRSGSTRSTWRSRLAEASAWASTASRPSRRWYWKCVICLPGKWWLCQGWGAVPSGCEACAQGDWVTAAAAQCPYQRRRNPGHDRCLPDAEDRSSPEAPKEFVVHATLSVEPEVLPAAPVYVCCLKTV